MMPVFVKIAIIDMVVVVSSAMLGCISSIWSEEGGKNAIGPVGLPLSFLDAAGTLSFCVFVVSSLLLPILAVAMVVFA